MHSLVYLPTAILRLTSYHSTSRDRQHISAQNSQAHSLYSGDAYQQSSTPDALFCLEQDWINRELGAVAVYTRCNYCHNAAV